MREPTREEWRDWTLAIEEKPKPDKFGSGFFENLMMLMFPPQRLTSEQAALMNAAMRNQANTYTQQNVAAMQNVGWSGLGLLGSIGGQGVKGLNDALLGKVERG